MKKILLIIFIASITLIIVAKKIDINTASLSELKSLPISEKQAEDIYEYRTFVSFFKSIYDLRNINSIDQKKLIELKPLISVSHYTDLDETSQRREEIYYLIRRFGNNEGSSEGASDEWEDFLMEQLNVNSASYRDIYNLPNVTPVGATAVIRQIKEIDRITNYRALRNIPKLTHYEATNMKHFVRYDNNLSNDFSLDIQIKYADKPFEEAAEDMYKQSILLTLDGSNTNAPRYKTQTFWGMLSMDKYQPEVSTKVRFSYKNFKGGILLHNRKGEASILNEDYDFNDAKYFTEYKKEILPGHKISIIGGNFRATYGEGLVMENTDFYNSRKTGYGFSKRIIGLIGDLSRTEEYALKGIAAEYENSFFNASLFYSNDKKDAVVYDSNGDHKFNGDDDVFSYITMSRRFTNEELEAVEKDIFSYLEENNSIQANFNPMAMSVRKDFLKEQIIGGHLEYSPIIGTHLGVTGYEAVYDKDFVIDSEVGKWLISHDDDTSAKFKLADSEITNMYSTKTADYDRDYRRVLGFDFGTSFQNYSISGEYAELSVDGEEFKIGDDPHALLLSSYFSFDNLYLLSIYRDYDLDFDNPYFRGFSEHEKFDDTVFDKNPHTLSNPLMSDVYINSAQSQAEKGVYTEIRYKITTKLTLDRTYLDIWERKSDSRKSVRFQGKLDYRPIYQISLRPRYKYQTNRYDDFAERGVSSSEEFEMTARYYLSNRNSFNLGYVKTMVYMPPYPYLTNDAVPDGTDNLPIGTNKIDGDAFYFSYTQNFNKNMKAMGTFFVWDNHGASVWDWEDVEIDFMGETGYKFLILFEDKIANNLYLSMKFKYKKYTGKDIEWRAWWNVYPSDDPTLLESDFLFKDVDKTEKSIRLQLDYKF